MRTVLLQATTIEKEYEMPPRNTTPPVPKPGEPLSTKDRTHLLSRVIQEIEEARSEHQSQRVLVGTALDRDEGAHPWGTHRDGGNEEETRATNVITESQLARTLEKLSEAKRKLDDPMFVGHCTCSCGCGGYVGIDRMMSAIGAVDISRCTRCASGECHRK